MAFDTTLAREPSVLPNDWKEWLVDPVEIPHHAFDQQIMGQWRPPTVAPRTLTSIGEAWTATSHPFSDPITIEVP